MHEERIEAMLRSRRWSLIILAMWAFMSGFAWAEVLVLKDGTKVSGKVVDKTTHYEVSTESGLRTYLKDEVEKLISSPRELLGDSDQAIEQAKAAYLKATQASDPTLQNSILKEALSKVKSARDAYALSRELFPEDKYADLDQKIVQIMQLTRMVRGSMHTDSGSAPRVPGSRPPSDLSAGALGADDALLTLLDVQKRSDPGRRAAAAASFRRQRASNPECYDMATAAMLFLSRTDPEWGFQGRAAGAIQDYFDKGWLKDPKKLTPAGHLEAANYLASRKADFGTAGEAANLFALAHLAATGAGPDREKAALALGFLVQNGQIGTHEGHAVHDLNAWIAPGDFDLAVMAFIKDYRSVDTPSVRYVWAYALLRLVQQRKRGFDRPVSALGTIQTSDASGREHLAALMKSIKAVGVCNVCLGEGKLRCTNCHGQKETKFLCARCKGKGHTLSSLGAKLVCPSCRGTGIERIVKCEKCKDGWNVCKQCDGKKRPAPELDDIFTASPCDLCEGRGLAFRQALYPCGACMGLGQKLQPKADPTKVLR
jgi:DnaJ-class molecular chaperone